MNRKSKPGETGPQPALVAVPAPASPPVPTALAELARGTGPGVGEVDPAPVPNRLYRRLVVALSATRPEQLAHLRQLVENTGRTPATVEGADIRHIEAALRGIANAHAVPYERALAHAKLDALIGELT